MTHDEVVDLLSAITAYDNRNASHATVLAWGKAAELGRWTLPEALDAVHAHFSENPAYLMPAHVTERIRANRQDRAMREQPAIEAVHDPVAVERIQALVAGVAEELAWDREERKPGAAALRVRCPHCAAAVGVRCVHPVTGKTLVESPCHPSRAEAQAEYLRGAS